VLEAEEAETLDFDLENIAQKGSRSSAFMSTTQVTTERTLLLLLNQIESNN
jgi:hypothetical protein